MSESKPLARREASDAVSGLGWRYVLASLRTHVAVTSLHEAVEVATVSSRAAGADGDEHLWVDLRHDAVVLSLQTRAVGSVTERDVELAGLVSAAVADLELRTAPGTGSGDGTTRSAQVVEIAIDALDIASIRPFWKAVLAYTDEAGNDGPQDPLIDPLDQWPAVWFQQMDAPRPQRNRIHLDVSVPHDEADARLAAALAAGGTLVSDVHAPLFWVLADAEGNEACVTTWQGRDP